MTKIYVIPSDGFFFKEQDISILVYLQTLSIEIDKIFYNKSENTNINVKKLSRIFSKTSSLHPIEEKDFNSILNRTSSLKENILIVADMSFEQKVISFLLENERINFKQDSIICLEYDKDEKWKLESIIDSNILNLMQNKDTEDKYKEIALDFNSILDYSSDYFYMKDTDYKFRTVNENFAKLTGHDHWIEMVDKTDFDVFPQDIAQMYRDDDENVIERKQSVLGRIESYPKEDGTEGWVKTSKLPVLDKNGDVVRMFGFSTDVTELIRTQEKSKKLLEKIRQQHQLLDDILNTTDNIMIITDFKDIKFSNDQFKSIMSINDTSEYNEESKHNMLDSLFMHYDGYLHMGLIKENESFEEVYANTRITNRKVLIMNKKLEPKAYSITMKKLINNNDYLITLSDISKMQEEFTKVENQAYIDGLTGVYNRNKFNELFTQELKRVQRYNEPLSIAIIDIDKFKTFNDTFGHLIGDEVLISMAQTVNNNVRETDTFARWGGEEFIIMFVNTPVEKAKIISETLKDKIEENKHQVAGKITASFGLTEYKNDDTIKTIFKRCDEALYQAKANGRNRVEVL